MANEENLKTLSPKEARKNGSKGGKASGEARRRKKSMREALEMLMQTEAPANVKATLKAAGINADDADYQLAVLAGQMMQAVKGNTRAAVWLSEIMGERTQNITVEQKIDDSRKALEEYLESKTKTDA